MKEVAALWALLAFVTVAVTFSLIQVQEVQHHQNDALRSIICQVQEAELHSPRASPQEKHQSVVFWSKALSKAHLAPCATP